jgi:hypothetical protein
MATLMECPDQKLSGNKHHEKKLSMLKFYTKTQIEEKEEMSWLTKIEVVSKRDLITGGQVPDNLG